MSDDCGHPNHGQPDHSCSSFVAAGGWCAPSEIIYDIENMNTRERRLWRGEVEPTPEEIATEIDRMMAEYLDDLKAWDETQVFLRRVEHAHARGLPQRILALHHREVRWCRHCNGQEGDPYDEPAWPCPTARLALLMYLEPRFIPDEPRYEEPAKPVRDESNPRWPFPSGPIDPFTFPEVSVRRGGIRFYTGLEPHLGADGVTMHYGVTDGD